MSDLAITEKHVCDRVRNIHRDHETISVQEIHLLRGSFERETDREKSLFNHLYTTVSIAADSVI